MLVRGNFISAFGIAGTSGAGLNSGRVWAETIATAAIIVTCRIIANLLPAANRAPDYRNRGLRESVRCLWAGGQTPNGGRQIRIGVAVRARVVPLKLCGTVVDDAQRPRKELPPSAIVKRDAHLARLG